MRERPVQLLASEPNDRRDASASDDGELVARIRAGDERAFEALFREYVTPLYRLALRYTREHADAEEVAQEVLLKLWERRATWIVRGSLRAYLFTVTRNHALNALRARTRREGGVRAQASVPPGDTSDSSASDTGHEIPGAGAVPLDPESALTAAEQTAILRRAIGALSPRRQEVLTLRWEYGLGYAEIALVLGISTRGVEQAHARAIQDLREALKPL